MRSVKDLLRALGFLYTRGIEIDLGELGGARTRRKVSLPTYPFERARHWLDFPEREYGATRASTIAPTDKLVERPISHPFAARMRSSRPAAASSGSGFVRKTDDESSAKGNS
jgi:acyl transferase domain-containing protein